MAGGSNRYFRLPLDPSLETETASAAKTRFRADNEIFLRTIRTNKCIICLAPFQRTVVGKPHVINERSRSGQRVTTAGFSFLIFFIRRSTVGIVFVFYIFFCRLTRYKITYYTVLLWRLYVRRDIRLLPVSERPSRREEKKKQNTNLCLMIHSNSDGYRTRVL